MAPFFSPPCVGILYHVASQWPGPLRWSWAHLYSLHSISDVSRSLNWVWALRLFLCKIVPYSMLLPTSFRSEFKSHKMHLIGRITSTALAVRVSMNIRLCNTGRSTRVKLPWMGNDPFHSITTSSCSSVPFPIALHHLPPVPAITPGSPAQFSGSQGPGQDFTFSLGPFLPTLAHVGLCPTLHRAF